MTPEEKQGFVEMFEVHGFENVSITTIKAPQHIIDWMKQTDEFEDDELEEIEREMEYYRVSTKQGEFGIFFMAYPMIDLTGTGLTLGELHPNEDLSDTSPNHPPISGFDASEKLLLRLWQLLVKKQQP